MSRYRTHTTARGIQVRSGFERKVLENLDARGVYYEYEPYSYNWFERIPRALCGECGAVAYAERWYTPDVHLGAEVFVEVKGKFTAKDRKIALGVREAHPEVEIRFLFQRDNTLSKASSTRYSGWCSANGFLHRVNSDGVIPEEWV